MKYFTKEVQIALVAVAGIAVLFFGLQFLKGLSIFSSSNNYYVVFDDVSGLSSSSPVYANGYKVGVVTDVTYNYATNKGVVATVSLDKQLNLAKTSRAEISTDMMGNTKVNIILGDGALGMAAPGDTISGGAEQGALGMAADMVPDIQKMLPKLDSILARINILLTDKSLDASLHNVEDITANLTVTTAQLNMLMASLNQRMPTMMDKADGVLDNADKLTEKLAAIDYAATLAKVDATLNNVEEMTAKLNSKEGTLGLLMRDPSLYNNLNSTMRSADSLLIDLKAHPKRYVHFSIFGKKDK